MKFFFGFALTLFFCFQMKAQTTTNKLQNAKPDSTKKTLIIEASCGQCQFGMSGKGCNLAVRIDGKSYFIDAADIDSFGDAHSDDGFCEAIRTAEVQGEIINNRFKATYFKLLLATEKTLLRANNYLKLYFSDTKNFPSTYYFIRIHTSEGSINRKIVLQ